MALAAICCFAAGCSVKDATNATESATAPPVSNIADLAPRESAAKLRITIELRIFEDIEWRNVCIWLKRCCIFDNSFDCPAR